MDGIDEGKSLAAAWDAWLEEWGTGRWDWWIRFRWRRHVTEETALAHLDALRTRLRRESRGTPFVTGLHRDPMRHAHAVWKMSRRQRVGILNADEAREFLQLRWRHGEVWCTRFDPPTGDPHGSIAYVLRHPETVGW